MAINYQALFNKHGLHGHTFFGYSDPYITKIVEVTAAGKRNFEKERKWAQKKGKTIRDSQNYQKGVIEPWAMTECDGPQSYEQFLCTSFKTAALHNEVLAILQGKPQASKPAPAPTPPKQEPTEAFTVTQTGRSEPPAPPDPTKQPDPESELPQDEQEDQTEEPAVDLKGMNLNELKTYALEVAGMPQEHVASYRGNAGRKALLQYLSDDNDE